MSTEPARIQVRGPGSLIAIVPHLLSFHPERSLVVVAMSGPHGLVKAVFRFDLPDPPDSTVATQIAHRTVTVLHRDKLTTVIVIGYGPGNVNVSSSLWASKN